MKFFTSLSKPVIKGPAIRYFLLLALLVIAACQDLLAQNVFSGEPVQWVGRPNGYNTEPYNSDYRTLAYRKLATTDANPTDGRGQWSTTINVQATGADITPDNMPGGGGAGWLLISGPAANRFQNKWNFTGVGQGALNSVNDVVLEGGGEDMGLNMGTAGYYTFNFRDAGYVNSQFYVGYTLSAPVTVSRTAETLNTVTNGTLISISTGAAPSAGENIYVRYNTVSNDFSTATTVIQANGSGTSWSAEIPSQDCGTIVHYYVYSSTRSSSQVDTDSETDRSLSAIRYDDNAGANYSYTSSTSVVVASTGANGTITPAGTTSFNCGDDAVYTITANSCYTIEDVVVDGVSQGAIGTYTFTAISDNHTISASFVINSFAVTASAGTGGTISPDAASNVNCGDDITYAITPEPCYSIADITVDGVSAGAANSYTFTNVTEAHTIVASFVLTPYTIAVVQGANGTILPGSGTVNCGDNATYTITPDACYSIADVLVDGISVGAVGSYTFTNVNEGHTITASYSTTTYTITATPGPNGTISPAGASIVNCGTNNVYTITSDVCYHVLDVLVDGISVGPVTTYTFTNTTSDHTISATFELNTSLLAPVVTGPVNVCSYIASGNAATYTASSAGAASYNWILPANVVIQSQTANSITVTFNPGFTAQGNHQIRVIALSPCGNSPLTVFYTVIQAPGTPTLITGNTNVCPIIGTPGTFTYSIPPVAGATSYNWTAQAGSTTIVHPNGPGVNDTIITVSFTVGFSNSSLTVSSQNACGTSGIRSINLVRVIPATPSPISGPTNICENIAPGGSVATYTITNVPGVNFNWTVPAGAIGLTGQNTNSISFTYPAGFTSGTVSVVAANGCAASATRTLNVNRLLPSTIGSVIFANQTDACPDRIFGYSVTSMPSHATSMLWTVPTSAGAVLLSGQGTTAITVSYPFAAVSGSVTVTAVNNCGSSAPRTLAVNLPQCTDGPPPPGGPRSAKGNPIAIVPAETMQVNVYPNPTVNEFKLQVVTAGKENIRVRVTDMQGRSIRSVEVMPYQTISIGSELKPGAYIMELTQGPVLKTTKLIKF